MCPIYGLSDETWNHVYMCPNEDMVCVRMSEINKMKTILELLKTIPELKSHFEEVLRQWYQGNILVQVKKTNSLYFEMLQIAHEDKIKIGFDPFVKGFLSKEWAEAQNDYYRKEIKDPVFNIDRWEKAIVTVLIDYRTKMWKERCSILLAEKNLTEESRYREFLQQFQPNLRRDSTKKLHVMDRFLFKK